MWKRPVHVLMTSIFVPPWAAGTLCSRTQVLYDLKKEELAFTDAMSDATVLRLRNYRLYMNVVTQGFRRTVSPEKRRSRVVQDLPGMVDDLVMANIAD
jgi:hypothetical protein